MARRRKIPKDTGYEQAYDLMMVTSIPAYCLVRELVQNGIEANLKYAEQKFQELLDAGKDPLESSPDPSKVILTRCRQNPSKLMVANVGGVYITEDIVENHLIAFAQSGTSKDKNFGIGMKYAMFKYYHKVEIRSKRAGEDVGVVYRIDGSPVGKLAYEIDDVKLEDFSVLGLEDSGTEIVVLGKTPDMKTYDIQHSEYRTRSAGSETGNNFFKYLCGRYSDPYVDCFGNEVKVVVDIFERGAASKKGKPKTCNSDFVRSLMSIDNDEWSVLKPFVLTHGPYAGAAVYTSILPHDEASTKRTNVRTRGGLILEKDNEIYDKFSPGSAYDHLSSVKSILRDCGLNGVDEKKVTRWLFRVNLDNFDNVSPAGDRLSLEDNDLEPAKTISLEVIADSIAQSLSGEVKQRILDDAEPPEDFDDEIKRLQQEYIDSFKYDFAGSSPRSANKNKNTVTPQNTPRTQSSPKNDILGDSPKRPLALQPFNLVHVSDGSKGPLQKVAIDPVTDEPTIYYNKDSQYHKIIFRAAENETKKLLKKDTGSVLATAFKQLSNEQKAISYWDAIKVEVSMAVLRKFIIRRQAEKEPGRDVISALTPEVLGFDVDPHKVSKYAEKRMKIYFNSRTGLAQ